MWEQVKLAMLESERELCDSVKVARKNPKIVWWNDEVKAVVRRYEAAWKEVLTTINEETKKDV